MYVDIDLLHVTNCWVIPTVGIFCLIMMYFF